MKTAVLADAGPDAGLGHLTRCLALAQALRRRRGIAPVFLVDDPAGRDWIRGRGFPVASARGRTWDLLIADSYRLSARDRAALRAQARAILCVDDTGLLTGPCDWLLNSGIHAHRVPYGRARARGLLLGPAFHPLRDEFWRLPAPPRQRSRVRDVLVTLGGGNTRRLLQPALAAVRNALPHAMVHAIIGPMSGKPPRDEPRLVLHHSPQAVRPIMEACDLAVCAGGQTLYELASLGIPAVAALLADNQSGNITGFAEAGSILSAGRPADNGFQRRLSSLVRRLAEDRALRARMAGAGRRAVDGRGALRVADVLLSTGHQDRSPCGPETPCAS